MEKTIEAFITHMEDIKSISKNTKLSYEGDLKKLIKYLSDQGITDLKKVTGTNLNSYILHMERQGLSNSTISRNLAVIRGYFHFLFRSHMIDEDITERLESPRIEKKESVKLSKNMVDQLLDVPVGKASKALRDKAMIRLLYDTGMQITEVIQLNAADVNLKLGYVQCKTHYKERTIPLTADTRHALRDYIKKGRPALMKKGDTELLFMNMRGTAMSRQGFWKMIKAHAEAAQLDMKITLRMLRQSS